MAADISTIPAEDREDFQKRLQLFGVDLSAVQEPLITEPSSVVNLDFRPNSPSARSPFVLRTTDLAQVKRMIGLDDRVAQKLSHRITLPSRVDLEGRLTRMARRPSGDSSRRGFMASPGVMMEDEGSDSKRSVSDEELRVLNSDDINNVRLAARAFVRGDSRLVSSFEPLFAKVIGTITIPIWALLSVHVAKGSVLEFGTGVHALVAHQITIEPGGKIVSKGHLTVNCTRLTRPGLAVRPFPTDLTSSVFRPIFSE